MIKPRAQYYQGTTYNKLSRELQRYGRPPDSITPLELMEWAVDVGQWSIHERWDDAGTFWMGPYGSPPIIGSELGEFRDRNVALQHMRAHYTVWWSQKVLVEKAFDLLSSMQEKQPCEKCDEDGTDFKLSF